MYHNNQHKHSINKIKVYKYNFKKEYRRFNRLV
jgi:hypothetical protein